MFSTFRPATSPMISSGIMARPAGVAGVMGPGRMVLTNGISEPFIGSAEFKGSDRTEHALRTHSDAYYHALWISSLPL